MIGFLSFVGRHATALLAVGVFVGLILPELAALARPLLIPAILVMLVAALLRLDASSVVALAKKPGRVVPAVIFVLLISPLIGFGLAEVIGLEGGARTALVIWSASPPLVSVTAIAVLVGLDGALTLGVMSLAGLLMPLTLPPIILMLIGLDLDISVVDLSMRLIGFLAVAALLAWIVRRGLGPDRLARHTQTIDGVVVVVMLIFAVAVMDGVTEAARADPGRIALLIGVVFGASLLLQLVGLILFLPFGGMAAGSVALTAGNRNMAIVLAAAPAAFEPETFLYLALLQFPIYLLPALLKPIYRRLASGP